MKKSTIWTIAIVIGISFITLLFLQTKYLKEVINMRKEQFDESVTRSLYQTARNLESVSYTHLTLPTTERV